VIPSAEVFLVRITRQVGKGQGPTIDRSRVVGTTDLGIPAVATARGNDGKTTGAHLHRRAPGGAIFLTALPRLNPSKKHRAACPRI